VNEQKGKNSFPQTPFLFALLQLRIEPFRFSLNKIRLRILLKKG
jgi:hypothetical protein